MTDEEIEKIRTDLTEALKDPDLPAELRSFGSIALAQGASTRSMCHERIRLRKEQNAREMARHNEGFFSRRSSDISLAEAEDCLEDIFDPTPLINSAPPEGTALWAIETWQRSRKARRVPPKETAP